MKWRNLLGALSVQLLGSCALCARQQLTAGAFGSMKWRSLLGALSVQLLGSCELCARLQLTTGLLGLMYLWPRVARGASSMR